MLALSKHKTSTVLNAAVPCVLHVFVTSPSKMVLKARTHHYTSPRCATVVRRYVLYTILCSTMRWKWEDIDVRPLYNMSLECILEMDDSMNKKKSCNSEWRQVIWEVVTVQ